MATTDLLTELANRRQFVARLTEEFARLQRFRDQRCSILMLDLDHFKQVNDTHGHATGDAVLKHTAQLIRNVLRTTDTAGRMDGEEFAVILPGSDLAGAQALAERLCELVAKSALAQDGRAISVTMSIGVATMNVADFEADEALVRANEALFRAKRNGRNRVDMAIQSRVRVAAY